MRTHTGRELNPRTMTWRDVTIADVARGLSAQYVWRGHSRDLLTYAEHSTILSQYVAPEHALGALLRVGFLAYVHPGSPSAVRVMDAINRAFGVTMTKSAWDAVRAVETRLYAAEARECWDETSRPKYDDAPLKCFVGKLAPRQAEHVFSSHFCDLYQGWS